MSELQKLVRVIDSSQNYSAAQPLSLSTTHVPSCSNGICIQNQLLVTDDQLLLHRIAVIAKPIKQYRSPNLASFIRRKETFALYLSCAGGTYILMFTIALLTPCRRIATHTKTPNVTTEITLLRSLKTAHTLPLKSFPIHPVR